MMIVVRPVLLASLLVSVALALTAAPPVASEPDTAVARLSWPGAALAPSAIALWPDTLMFGGDALVIIDHEPGLQPLPLDSLLVDAPWLDLVPVGTDLAPPDLPAASGARLVARFRVYREGPWRVAGADGVSINCLLMMFFTSRCGVRVLRPAT